MNVSGSTASFWQGDLTLSYTICDAAGNVSNGQVVIPAPNAAPVTGIDTATVLSAATALIDVLANDVDPEGGELTLVQAEAVNGSADISETGMLSYTAPSAFGGADTVTYVVQDPAGNTSEGTVNITVKSIGEPPVAQDDTASAIAGVTTTIDVLANDTDPEGEVLTVSGASAVSGTVTIQADHTLSYTANAGFAGDDTITYQIRDAAGNTDTGEVTVTVTPLEIAINTETSLGDFTVEAVEGIFHLSVIEPTASAATYEITTADLSSGPVLLEQGQISGNTAAGGTVDVTRGIWAGDETHGALGFTQQWYRGGTAISGATGTSYVVTQGDIDAGLRLAQTATNAAGSTTIQMVVLAAPLAFTENGVVFKSTRLQRNADLAPADNHSVAYFVSLSPNAVNRQGILRQDATNHGIDIWEGQLRFRVPGATAQSRPLTVKQRTNILAIATPDGSDTTVKLYSRFEGETDWSLDSMMTGNGPVDLTFGVFAVGGSPDATSQTLNGTLHRLACWSGLASDFSDTALQEHFLKPDGTLQDPVVSHIAYGTPHVDLYGPAADYALGINNGTAGNFDIVEGTFSDA